MAEGRPGVMTIVVAVAVGWLAHMLWERVKTAMWRHMWEKNPTQAREDVRRRLLSGMDQQALKRMHDAVTDELTRRREP